MSVIKLNAAKSYLEGLTLGRLILERATIAKTKMVNGDVGYDLVETIFEQLVQARKRYNTLKDIPGVIDIVNAEKINSTYNVQIDFPALITEIEATLDLIVSLVPVSGNWNTVSKLETDYSTTYRQFTPAQTLPIQTALQEIIDTITIVEEPAASQP
jgi:hypothetical protein